MDTEGSSEGVRLDVIRCKVQICFQAKKVVIQLRSGFIKYY